MTWVCACKTPDWPKGSVFPEPQCSYCEESTEMNSRAKGKRGELEFIQTHLLPFWPDAKRNLDQFGDDKRDCLEVAGIHFQIKRTEKLELWAALKQAESEARNGDLPVVAFRRNRSKWYCVVDAETLVRLLAERG